MDTPERTDNEVRLPTDPQYIHLNGLSDPHSVRQIEYKAHDGRCVILDLDENSLLLGIEIF